MKKYIQTVKNGAVYVNELDGDCFPVFSVVFNGSYYNFDGVRVINCAPSPADATEAKAFFEACIAAIDYATLNTTGI